MLSTPPPSGRSWGWVMEADQPLAPVIRLAVLGAYNAHRERLAELGRRNVPFRRYVHPNQLAEQQCLDPECLCHEPPGAA